MTAPAATAKLIRAGVLLPGLVALLGLSDLGSRFVPLRSLAFRPWEALRETSGREAPFLPGRREERTTFGDLANLGGVPFPADRRRELFTTDARGFRNSVNMAGDGPVGAVLIGDSFIAGGGLSDEDTLAARLRETLGARVFNAGGMSVWTRERLDEILVVSGLAPGGVVVYALSAPSHLPYAPTPRMRRSGRESPPAVRTESDFGISRLGVLARRFGGRIAAAARLSPGGEVLRRPLGNGDVMLFMTPRPYEPRQVAASVVDSWVSLREALGVRGLGVLVLLIPGKDLAYGELLAEPLPARPSTASPQIAAALAGRGVPVLDLGPVLGEAARAGLESRRYVFWRDDTHWSPLGVRVAATELAAALPAARWAPTESTAAPGKGAERPAGR